MLAARHRPPWVCDLYNPELFEGLEVHAQRSPRRRRALDVVRIDRLAYAARTADAFVCASERQRDMWLGFLGASRRLRSADHARDRDLRGLIDVVAAGVPDAPAHPLGAPAAAGLGAAADARIVLWNGGLWPWLDPELVARAVAALRRTDPRWVLVVSGAGRARGESGTRRDARAARAPARRRAARRGRLDAVRRAGRPAARGRRRRLHASPRGRGPLRRPHAAAGLRVGRAADRLHRRRCDVGRRRGARPGPRGRRGRRGGARRGAGGGRRSAAAPPTPTRSPRSPPSAAGARRPPRSSPRSSASRRTRPGGRTSSRGWSARGTRPRGGSAAADRRPGRGQSASRRHQAPVQSVRSIGVRIACAARKSSTAWRQASTAP